MGAECPVKNDAFGPNPMGGEYGRHLLDGLGVDLAPIGYRVPNQGKNSLLNQRKNSLTFTPKSKDGLQEALDYYRSMDCLVVDDWMNTPMNHNELMLIREIMDYRPKYGGTILVSHTQPDDWASMMQTNASYKVSMIKTLTEGATVVNLE
jgi:DNA replication protein DnaC